MVSPDGWLIEVHDPQLRIIGRLDVWTKLSMTLRHNRGDGWILDLPQHPQAQILTQGCGLVVWAPWSASTPLMSGPVTAFDVKTPESGAPATLTVTGVDDTALLADRIVLPDPASDLPNQTADTYWTATGPAEALIRTVVDVNAGQAARTNRRMCVADPTGRVPAGVCVGSVRSATARFDPLLTLVAELAATDQLSVRLIQPPGVSARHLQVTPTVDRSGQVRLSQPAGTIVSGTARAAAPSATTVLVAGGGEGTARTLLAQTDTALEAQWARRIETVRDARDTIDLAEMADRAAETLATAGVTSALSVDPVDLPGTQFGVHYNLGDTVTVDMGGTTWTEVITAVQIDVSRGEATTVKPLLGDADAADNRTPAIYTRVAQILRRLDALERRQ